MDKAPLPEQFTITSDHTDAQSLSMSTQNIPLAGFTNWQVTKDNEKRIENVSRGRLTSILSIPAIAPAGELFQIFNPIRQLFAPMI
jgi:hypothetical protein